MLSHIQPIFWPFIVLVSNSFLFLFFLTEASYLVEIKKKKILYNFIFPTMVYIILHSLCFFTAEVMKSLDIPRGVRRVLFRTLNTDRLLI